MSTNRGIRFSKTNVSNFYKYSNILENALFDFDTGKSTLSEQQSMTTTTTPPPPSSSSTSSSSSSSGAEASSSSSSTVLRNTTANAIVQGPVISDTTHSRSVVTNVAKDLIGDNEIKALMSRISKNKYADLDLVERLITIESVDAAILSCFQTLQNANTLQWSNVQQTIENQQWDTKPQEFFDKHFKHTDTFSRILESNRNLKKNICKQLNLSFNEHDMFLTTIVI